MRSGIVVWLCLGGATICAQTAPPVTLDVIVDNAAQARQPLSAADFIVTDAGESMAVQSARLVLPPSDRAPLPPIENDADEATAAAQADRLVGVFVDEYHLQDDAAFAAARASVASFLRKELGPRDLVVVVKPLDSLVSLRMTADRDAAARIVESASPRQGDYTPRSDFERDFFAGAPARLDAARNQIALSAVSALTAHLGRFPAGRKTLLVVSNGIVGTVARREGPLPAAVSIVRAANMAHVAVYALRPSPAQDAKPIDDRATDSREEAPRDALVGLAEQTTGLVVNGGNVGIGLQQALRDASRYYLLALAPAPSVSSSRFQPVDVSLRTPGAPVRARAGFGVPGRDLFVPRSVSRPVGLTIPRHTSNLIRTWFGQSAAEADVTTVAFVWEPAPRVPVARGPAPTPARVAMRVTTMDGGVVFEGTTGPSGRGATLVPGSRPELSFSAPPGGLLVQMDVLDPAGRVLDHDVRDLTVAAFRRPLALGTASVFRGRTPRDVDAIVNADTSVAPVAAREFSRAEHLIVRIPLINQGGPPQVTVQLQNRFGAAIRQVPATVLASSGTTVQADLPLAPLASGGYTLVFTVRNNLGSAVESVDFGVTP
jgi:VWFA-related protein